MRTRTVISALALVALAALSGCGSDSGDEKGSAEHVLTKAEIKSALLSLDDLGDGFRVDEDADDEDDSSLGCLDEIDEIDTVADPARDDEVSYEADSDFALPGVFSSIASFKTTATAEKGMAELRKVLDDCTSIDETDEDGARVRLRITTDDEKVGADADEQINIKASGNIEVEGFTLPMAFQMSLIRIDNQAALAGFVTVSEDASKEAAKIIDAAFTRFAPVAQGKAAETPSPLDLEQVDLADFLPAGAA